MNDSNIIDINSGSYYIIDGSIKQEMNTYAITSENEESIKHEKRDVVQTDTNNWFTKNNLDVNDLVLYLQWE
jgi:hypothetical protein